MSARRRSTPWVLSILVASMLGCAGPEPAEPEPIPERVSAVERRESAQPVVERQPAVECRRSLSDAFFPCGAGWRRSARRAGYRPATKDVDVLRPFPALAGDTHIDQQSRGAHRTGPYVS